MLLITTEHGKQIVAACCVGSSRARVQPGMSLAHAQSLLTDCSIIVEHYTPDEYGKRLNALAQWARRFSPIVQCDIPDGLLLDITGCAHLFGGEERLISKVATSFDTLDVPSRCAIASTAGCAWAIARYGRNKTAVVASGVERILLEPFPTAALRLSPQVRDALADVAITEVGHLLALSREQLAARFEMARVNATRTHGVFERGLSSVS